MFWRSPASQPWPVMFTDTPGCLSSQGSTPARIMPPVHHSALKAALLGSVGSHLAWMSLIVVMAQISITTGAGTAVGAGVAVTTCGTPVWLITWVTTWVWGTTCVTTCVWFTTCVTTWAVAGAQAASKLAVAAKPAAFMKSRLENFFCSILILLLSVSPAPMTCENGSSRVPRGASVCRRVCCVAVSNQSPGLGHVKMRDGEPLELGNWYSCCKKCCGDLR